MAGILQLASAFPVRVDESFCDVNHSIFLFFPSSSCSFTLIYTETIIVASVGDSKAHHVSQFS